MKTLSFCSCAVILSVISNMSVAAPAVRGVSASGGTLNDGATVTVSGSGFGSNSLNIQWLGGSTGLIERGELNTTPANGGGWVFDQGVGCNMKISNSQAHSGTKSLYCSENTSNAYNAAVRYGHSAAIAPGQDIFTSWWTRRTHTGSGQWKMFRLSYENNISDSAPETVMFNWHDSSQFFVRMTYSSSDPGSWGMPMPKEDNRWYRMDYHVRTSTGSDGSFTISMHDPSSGSAIRSTSITGRSYHNSNYYRWFLWQNYMGNGISAQQVWLDDLFIQVGSRARVELGNTATWSTNTYREIQRPTQWADGSISLALNRGAFRPGDTAYLFVVDPSGAASPGYAITIGGGSTETPTQAAPLPPGNFDVRVTE